jgi:streptogramin lyase
MSEITQGTRLNNNCTVLDRGEYSKQADGTFWFRTPNGMMGRLNPKIHSIVEHPDNTISVSPSILMTVPDGAMSWHGYLEKGIWREC